MARRRVQLRVEADQSAMQDPRQGAGQSLEAGLPAERGQRARRDPQANLGLAAEVVGGLQADLLGGGLAAGTTGLAAKAKEGGHAVALGHAGHAAQAFIPDRRMTETDSGFMSQTLTRE